MSNSCCDIAKRGEFAPYYPRQGRLTASHNDREGPFHSLDRGPLRPGRARPDPIAADVEANLTVRPGDVSQRRAADIRPAFLATVSRVNDEVAESPSWRRRSACQQLADRAVAGDEYDKPTTAR